MKKEQVLLSTSYFPSIAYIAVLRNFDCKIELYENYQKRSRRNKCDILAANGILQLSVPLKKGKTQKPITEVEIDYSEDWVLNHTRSIRSAYGTSAYFDFYYDRICDILNLRPSKLHQLNQLILEWLLKLDLIKEFNYTKSFAHPGGNTFIDFRYQDIEVVNLPDYDQVFTEKYGFVANLSILDLIFNLGPEASLFLNTVQLKSP